MQPCFQITQTRRCLVRNRWHEVAISIMLSWSRKKKPLLATPHKRIKNRLRAWIYLVEKLGMPLHGPQEVACRPVQGLDHAVGRDGHDLESSSRLTNRLMVIAIHRNLSLPCEQ